MIIGIFSNFCDFLDFPNFKSSVFSDFPNFWLSGFSDFQIFYLNFRAKIFLFRSI